MPVKLNKQGTIPKLQRYPTTKMPEEQVVGVKRPLNSTIQKSVKPKKTESADSAPDKKSE
jgi:hypothetical protein